MSLNTEQLNFLLAPINPSRVRQVQNNDHLEAWDVRRHLLRGFGWGGFSIETLECALVKEVETPGNSGASRWTVVYRAQVRLTLKDPDGNVLTFFDDGAIGDAINQPKLGEAHDLAMKSALSQALKRCCVNAGDAFGLSLYNKGSRDAVVGRSLAHPHTDQVAAHDVVRGGELDEHVIEITEPVPDTPSGEQEAAPAPSETNGSRAPEEVPAEHLADQVGRVRDQVLDLLKVPTKPKDALGALTRISLDASRAKLMDQPTLTPKGEQTTVRVLIDEAIKYVSREQVKS